jgi:FtsP/CotA-like multicopper oxidase with cupredoxin domain
VGDTLVQPVEVRSRNGVLDVGLAVQMDTFVVPFRRGDTLTHDTLALRSYRLTRIGTDPVGASPAFPGPTFRVTPGDRVRIFLENDLPWTDDDRSSGCMSYGGTTGNPPVDSMPNCFHGPNSTNIHYHGFHVTPNSPGDNVLMQIAPDSTFQYDFQVPLNQSAGTHWYHPHKHGSVALQVINGMSGAFIVEDTARGLDSIVRVNRMREHLIAIQQIDSMLNLIGGVDRHKVPLVNGQLTPVVVMRPGEVQRWRIVNENVELATNYSLMFRPTAGTAGPAMYDVARDGIQFAPANYDPTSPDTALITAPGNRLDVFVQAPLTEGVHHFLAVPHAGSQGQNVRRPGRGGAAPEDTAVILPSTALLIVQVVPAGSEPYPASLPASLPPLAAFLQNVDTAGVGERARVVFSDSLTRTVGNPSRFYLGTTQTPRMRLSDTVYVPQTAAGRPVPMVLGQAQVWDVVNYSTGVNHPFHIHINPFQVLEVSYPAGNGDPNALLYAQLNAAAANGNPIWLDVVPLPIADGNGTPGRVTIAQRYDPFLGCPDCGEPTGRFVMHCHILGHEERGMMQILEIVPAGPTPGGARGGGGHHHH